MTWEEFQIEKKDYEAAWNRIREAASRPMAAFLKRSRIVFACGRHFEMDAEPIAAYKDCPAFFLPCPSLDELKDLAEDLKEAEKSGTVGGGEGTVLGRERAALTRRLKAFDGRRLQVIDNWRVEVCFPFVDIDLIQELKQSPYCDQERTMMRPASIAVVLKKEIPHAKEK